MEERELDRGKAYGLAVDSLKTATRIIVCGDEDQLELLEEQQELVDDSLEEILAKSEKIDARQWVGEREGMSGEEHIAASITGWDSAVDAGRIAQFYLDQPSPYETASDSLWAFGLTVDRSWHIPAHFRFGGWNECPLPEVHCAMWRYWQEKYDAHIVGMSGSIIEAKIFQPPQTNKEALSLAREQYAYCEDIVSQGVGTVGKLASTLARQDKWYFWWD